jgi:3-deoxy-manno-octulosonate cytidylyltransferase (CMP-KDO synthetase)
VRVAIVIPARWASSRFPGKPLAPLRGPDGTKSLIRRTWEAAMAVPDIAAVAVATDDARVAEHAAGFGAQVLMTAATHRNGTERVAEAAKALPADLYVNLQGDALLTPPGFVTALVAAMAGGAVPVATPVLAADATTRARLRADRAAGRVGATTAVMDRTGRALYFSKEVLPFGDESVPVFHHVGLYAYRPDALAAYAAFPPGALETAEGLEQLRFLENGWPVFCVPVNAGGREFWELNNPVDVARIEAALAAMP